MNNAEAQHATSCFLTSEDLADLLHVKIETVAKWRRDKRGPDFVIVGNRRLYAMADVERWLEQRRQATEQ
jgi:hypothetical protein